MWNIWASQMSDDNYANKQNENINNNLAFDLGKI